MSKPITISRDPFARVDVVRQKVNQGTCAWCGQPARWRYGTYQDGIRTRPQMQARVFCSKACERSFNH